MRAPLATCELQGYSFAAQQMAAVISWILGTHEEAKAYWYAASELKARFNRDWWMEEETCVARALDLAEGMMSLTRLYDRGRVPECVGGYSRAEFPHPGAYPRANPIQAWNQSGLVLVMQSLLGLQPVAMIHTLFVDPALPPWLPEVTVRRLRLGDVTATLRFWRDDSGDSHADVVEKQGKFHLVRQPPARVVARRDT